MAERLDEIHPGEILLEDFLKPMGISARQLAADIDVSPSRISEVVNGQRPITADTALRLGLFFSMEPRFWLNLQTEYDMRVAARMGMDAIATRIRVFSNRCKPDKRLLAAPLRRLGQSRRHFPRYRFLFCTGKLAVFAQDADHLPVDAGRAG